MDICIYSTKKYYISVHINRICEFTPKIFKYFWSHPTYSV